MLLNEVQKYLDAEVLSCEKKLSDEVLTGCGSDLMSDVLAFSKEKGVLLTGLMNQQVIRTAEMKDLVAVVFVRGKHPSDDIINLAEEMEIVILKTKHSLFTAAGMLYSKGLGGDIHRYD